jgi:hypothetical protein
MPITAHVHTTGSWPIRAASRQGGRRSPFLPPSRALHFPSRGKPESLLSLQQHYAVRAVHASALVPVLCMLTDYGRCGVHILQPLRSPVGCVCPQQSKSLRFAHAWQPLPRSLTSHPPRTTPVWDPSTLARMQCDGKVIVLACLLTSGRVTPMASLRGSATWVGSNLWAFQWCTHAVLGCQTAVCTCPIMCQLPGLLLGPSSAGEGVKEVR